MKLTNTQNMKRKSGMTLIELTVVILVLLSLIAILFVGAAAWKKGSDRAACIMNQRNVQQAVRGHQNMSGANPGDAGLLTAAIIGTDGYIQTQPVCPSATGGYPASIDGAYPALGVLAYPCDAATTLQHVPNVIAGW